MHQGYSISAEAGAATASIDARLNAAIATNLVKPGLEWRDMVNSPFAIASSIIAASASA